MSEQLSKEERAAKREKSLEYINTHKISRSMINFIFRSYARMRHGIDPDNTVLTTGFFEGSAIGNPLTFPSPDKTWLTHERAPAGRWVGYDFKKHEQFPESYGEGGSLAETGKGRLVAFVLDEIKDNEPDDLTEIGTLQIFDIRHILQFETYTADELIEIGALALRSVGQAYEQVGMYDEFRNELRSRSVIDDPVYQVTPKGNTLVYLSPDSGEQDFQPEGATESRWLPSGIATSH